MAIKRNGNIRGRVGDVVFRKYGDKTIMSAAPRKRSNYAKTPQEMKVHLLFKKRVRYASKATADPVLRAMYASRSKAPYKLAFADAVHAPEVKSIDVKHYTSKPGSHILIEALDDFMVKEVRVDIVDGCGQFIESGFAVESEDQLHWQYTAQNANLHLQGTTIAAHAFDHPRNCGSLEVEL